MQLQPRTFRTLLLLLYGAGLRRGEALRLTRADADRALMTVRETKFFKSRPVPVGPDPLRVVEDYAAWRAAARARRSLPGEPRRRSP